MKTLHSDKEQKPVENINQKTEQEITSAGNASSDKKTNPWVWILIIVLIAAALYMLGVYLNKQKNG